MVLRLFDTKDEKYVEDKMMEFLKEEESNGNVDVTMQGKGFINARIVKGKRLNFKLYYNGFMLEDKTLGLGMGILNIGKQTVFLNEFDLKMLDNIQVCVE